MLTRAVISSMHGFAIAMGQFYLPLNVLHTLNCTSTIFTFMLNYSLYHIKITANQGIAAVVAFLGILLTVNGRLLYQLIDHDHAFPTSFANYKSNGLGEQMLAASALVCWMVVWGYGVIITNKTKSPFNDVILLNSVVGVYVFGLAYLTL